MEQHNALNDAQAPVHPVDRKKIVPWIVLLFSPIISLIIVASLQFIVQAAAAGSDSISAIVVNIISLLFGLAAVIAIILTPLWIVLLVKAVDHNRQIDGFRGKSKTVAVLLAVFFGFWAWLYIYKKSAWKFWVNLALNVVTFGIFGFASWIWAIIDTAVKPDAFYESFGS